MSTSTPTLDEQRRIRHELQDLYDDNSKPFYTKKAIKDIEDQLLNADNNTEIRMTNLKGQTKMVKVFDVTLKGNWKVAIIPVSFNTMMSFKAYSNWSDTTVDFFNTPGFDPFNSLTLQPCSWSAEPERWEACSVPKVRRGFDLWKKSDECKRLVSILDSNALPESITKIIGFGLGRLSSEDQCRTLGQNAAILTIRMVLERSGQAKVKCYAQDPAYLDSDRSILKNCGITVLDRQNGLLEVDEDSVIISGDPSFPLMEFLADVARPAVILGVPLVDKREHSPMVPKRDSLPRVAAMDKDYDFYDLVDPRGPDPGFFKCALLYGVHIRKADPKFEMKH